MEPEKARGAGPARGAAWTLAVAALAGVLVFQAVRARGEAADLRARGRALDREIERLQRGNQALRDELRALETDPLYVESLLRRWGRAGGRERPPD
jgi:hypothetical protein